MRKSKFLLFILSSHIFDSEWCMKELRTAVESGIGIVLVKHPDAHWDGLDFPPDRYIYKEIAPAFSSVAVNYQRDFHDQSLDKIFRRVGVLGPSRFIRDPQSRDQMLPYKDLVCTFLAIRTNTARPFIQWSSVRWAAW